MSSTLDLSTLLEAGVKPGRRGTALPFAVTRELAPEDLLGAGTAGSTKPIAIQQLRQSHHQLARLIAQGEKPAVISEILGYSYSRISILKSDPQMQELIEHYKGLESHQHELSRADFHQRLGALGFDSIEILHERLLDDPESITTGELLKITEAVADRTGHGKTSTANLNVTSLTLTAEELNTIRGGAATSAPNPASEENREALLRLAVLSTGAHSSSKEEGSESEGDCVREESAESPAKAVVGELLP